MSRVLNEPRFPFALGIHSDPIGVASSDIIDELSSPEDGIKKSLIIDMKDLVGDAVGNVTFFPPIFFLPHLDVDEHQSFIPRLGPCCVSSPIFVRPHRLTVCRCEGAMVSSL